MWDTMKSSLFDKTDFLGKALNWKGVKKIVDKRMMGQIIELLDPETPDYHTLTMSVLEKVTGKQFDNDPEKWRNWYQTEKKKR